MLHILNHKDYVFYSGESTDLLTLPSFVNHILTLFYISSLSKRNLSGEKLLMVLKPSLYRRDDSVGTSIE